MDLLKQDDWVTETLVAGWRQQIQIKKLLAKETTPYQSLVVFESENLGNVMLIDDRIQLCLADESVYHEMFAHVPLLAHGSAKEVLIIGGGDGATLREVVKHKSVNITLVDIDAKVIEFSRTHLSALHKGAWDSSRVEVVVDDGTVFVRETKKKFDVILIDSTDPEEGGPSSVLFQKQFYSDCKGCLAPGGIVITQNGHPLWETYPVIALTDLAKVFNSVTVYQFCVPTYLGGVQTLGWGCDDASKLKVSLEELTRRWEEADIKDVIHYCPSFHIGSFMLPLWVEKMVTKARTDATKNGSS